MDVERRESGNYQTLALTVERLATIVEMGNQNRAADMVAIREKLSEKNEDIRVLKHDVANIAQTMQTLPMMSDRLSEVNKAVATHTPRIEALESYRDKNMDNVAKIPALDDKIDKLEAWKLAITSEAGAYKKIGSGVWTLIGLGVGLVPFFYQYFHAGKVIISGSE